MYVVPCVLGLLLCHKNRCFDYFACNLLKIVIFRLLVPFDVVRTTFTESTHHRILYFYLQYILQKSK
jgi:hypothetical protein